MNDNVIIHKIGLKYGLSDSDVEEIIRLTYKFVRNTIENGDRDKVDFKNIKVPGLGTFYVSDKYKKFIKNVLNERCKVKCGDCD